MKKQRWSQTPIALALIICFLNAESMIGAVAQTPQGAPQMAGDLMAQGSVTVNDKNAVSGLTILSGDIITTGQNSRAVIYLGRNSRIELQPNTSARLTFTDASVSTGLDAGAIRLALPAKVSSTVTTTSGMAVSETTQAAIYSVDVSCGDIKVMSETGRVALRDNNRVKQVAAGETATSGQVAPGARCAQPAAAGGGLATLGIGGFGIFAPFTIIGMTTGITILAPQYRHQPLPIGPTEF